MICFTLETDFLKLPFAALNVPILLISDAPESHTGLGRIGRDLASLLSTMPEFRVGYLGRGGIGRRAFPWMQYGYPEVYQWGEDFIEQVWNDFSGGQNGIIMSLWDLSRMLWFGQPQSLNEGKLRRFLGAGRNFEKWAYVPVDATGPDGVSLGVGMAGALAGYDRALAASEWGMDVMKATGREDADWLPHGIWMERFRSKPGAPALTRACLGWSADDIHIGCVMTNQARKDWPAAFECAAILRMEYGNRLKFWIHTDALINYWNLYALATDFGIADCLDVTLDLTDEQLALRYAACDTTILPSGGEGFGYPIAESMACGTSCVVTGYAAGQELVRDDCKVRPVTFKVETMHNVQRAVLSGHGFAGLAKGHIERKRDDWEGESERMRDLVNHLDWNGPLKTMWRRWFCAGLR